MKFLPVFICLGLVLQGCAISGLARNGGASLGSGAGETVGGIVGGGLVMRAREADLSRAERLTAVKAEYRALETAQGGQPVTWSDEGTGNSGTVVAGQPYRVGSQDCRAYSHRLQVNGAENTARGTACRNEDGSWTLLD